jgi:hypothetical protein
MNVPPNKSPHQQLEIIKKQKAARVVNCPIPGENKKLQSTDKEIYKVLATTAAL